MLRRPLLVGLALLGLAGCDSLNSQQGYEPVQPIAFSHALHAGQYDINCQYCHSGAESSRHAGIPPASTCVNCHSQVKKDSPEVKKITDAVAAGKPIEWIKVHRLPDHAYFPHSSHVRAGVKCHAFTARCAELSKLSTPELRSSATRSTAPLAPIFTRNSTRPSMPRRSASGGYSGARFVGSLLGSSSTFAPRSAFSQASATLVSTVNVCCSGDVLRGSLTAGEGSRVGGVS